MRCCYFTTIQFQFILRFVRILTELEMYIFDFDFTLFNKYATSALLLIFLCNLNDSYFIHSTSFFN